MHSGDDRYLHVEVQAQPQPNFERRAYTYHYRADDRFGLPVEAIVILADEDPGWRPSKYHVELILTRQSFEFTPIKILDWRGREEELKKHPNPVALFVLAHLESQRTHGDDAERARVKLDLILRLHERKLDGEELRHWYRYLDWLLALPKDQETQVWQEVKRLEKEKKMPFITFAERYGMELGLEKGMEKGLEQGLEQGREEASREYLRKAIALGVRLKFRADSEAFLTELHPSCKSASLESIFNAIEGANTIDDLRKLIPQPSA